MSGISGLIRRGVRACLCALSSSLSHSPHCARAKGDSHLQTGSGCSAQTLDPLCPDLGLPSPLSCEMTRFCCLNHPVYGNLLRQPKWTKICSSADLEGAGKVQGCWRFKEKGTVEPWKFPRRQEGISSKSEKGHESSHRGNGKGGMGERKVGCVLMTASPPGDPGSCSH